MKKNLLFGAVASIAVAVTITASAAGFTKTNTYTPGQFTDVNADQWYAGSVASAYELGFMKGSSATTFDPDGSMTVAEAITIASRVNDSYASKGTSFDQSSGNNWYDCYVDYAVSSGIIEKEQFNDFERTITRAEMAKVFAKAVPADYLKAQNDVKKIPDVPSTNSYFEELKLLYNAGVIMGNDAYGTFKPNNSITRSEASAIIGRIALPENRLTKTLVDADYGDAYYLVYDASPRFKTGDIGTTTISSWNIDNRALNKGSAGVGLTDNSKNYKVEAWRDIDDVTEGLIGVDFYGTVENGSDGVSYMITDDEKKPLFKLETVEGKYIFNGYDTGVTVANGSLYFNIRADLDAHFAELYLNGKKIGDKHSVSDVVASRFYIASDEECVTYIRPFRIDVHKDYIVNDLFITPTDSDMTQWAVNGSAKVEATGGQGYNDTNSAAMYENTIAKKVFNKAVSGSVVFEAYMLLPTANDTGYISLNYGDASVAKLSVNSEGVFNGKGQKLRHHTNNIWQTLRIEADTVTGTVTYKVNGKKVGTDTLDSYSPVVDNITIANTSGKIYVDDITVYMTHEYDDYVPVPKPITDDGYDVILNICSLWREGTHSGWGSESAFPDIEPALGYYDEGITEVADWEIKFMVENGIDVQHFCWYCPSNDIKEPMKRPNLNFALHDGFFNAKYSDMMKFTLMWENNGVNCKSLEQFKEYIWSYWIDYYFLDDRFYTIDNKIVFTVWNYNNFKTAFGNTIEGAKAAVDFMNEDIKKYGFDGVMIFFADGHNTTAPAFKAMSDMGGTASYAYHWNQDGNSAAASIKRLDNNRNLNEIYIVPTVSVGFNNLGWSGVRKPLATLEDHRTVLEYIKNDYLPMMPEWRANTLIVSTWNEYGEGTYIMPSKGLQGFGYLENVAEVISGVTDHSNNIYPTEQQKARLGHLYPKSKTSLERLDYYKPSIDESEYSPLYTATGDDFADGQRIDESRIEDGIYYATTDKSDPITVLKADRQFAPIDTKLVTALKLVVKVDTTSYTELFFTTEESPNASQDKCFGFTTNATGEFVEYIIPTSKCNSFVGTLKSMRFDIVTKDGSYAIKEFSLLGYDESKKPMNIIVNSNKIEPVISPEERNGELYLAVEPDTGFFHRHSFYYEWSRFTNTLKIVSADNKEIIFTVGSDKALFNGKELSLKEKISSIDGIPVLPLYFLYDTLGISYEIEGKTLNVYALYSDDDRKFVEIIKNRKPNEWEFKVIGDLEGFSAGNCNIQADGEYLTGVSTAKSTGGYDPIVNISDLNVDSSKYNCITVGMKHKLGEGQESSHIEVFFTTDKDKTATQSKSAALPITSKESEEVIEYNFNISKNNLWKDTIVYLRIDPISSSGEFAIDYIRLGYNEEYASEAEKEYEAWLKKGFSIVNGDAEDTENATAFFNAPTSSTITIENDEEKGNVWQNIAKAGYSYSKQSVVWEPGKTYKVSVDVKLLGTNTGKTDGVSTKFHCNAVYIDANGNKDHVVFGGDIAVSDGWKKFNFEFTLPGDFKPTSDDVFSFYTNPYDNAGCSYRFDNVKVTVK